MAQWRKLLEKLLAGSMDLRFDEFVLLLNHFGFVLDRTRGSHHIFVHPGVAELLSIQPRNEGKAKLYQLRQFLKLVKDYHINIFYSQEDGEYIAHIPDLKYCSASGATPEEALREVLQAKALWLEVARQHNRPIPEPRYRPVIYQVSG